MNAKRPRAPSAEEKTHLVMRLLETCARDFDWCSSRMAEALGANEEYLEHIFRGQAEPSYWLAFELADYLGVSVYEVIDREQPGQTTHSLARVKPGVSK